MHTLFSLNLVVPDDDDELEEWIKELLKLLKFGLIPEDLFFYLVAVLSGAGTLVILNL